MNTVNAVEVSIGNYESEKKKPAVYWGEGKVENWPADIYKNSCRVRTRERNSQGSRKKTVSYRTQWELLSWIPGATLHLPCRVEGSP